MQLTDGYVVFSESLFFELRLLLLGGFLLAAAAIDLRWRRIPNLLVLGGLLTAFAYHLIDPLPVGWLRAGAGMALGFAMLLPFYLLRGMAAGDVKLMAMTGAFLGPQATLWAVLMSFLVGGVWALLLVFGRRAWSQLWTDMKVALYSALSPWGFDGASASGSAPLRSSVGLIPYGVAIAAGTILSLTVFRPGNF